MTDTRLVQTAVLGAPDSTLPVYFPPEHDESVQFRREHDGQRFFCGHFLGGCGGELVTKISDLYDIVSHFAHHPDAPPCPHKSTHRTGVDAADHLYIHNGLIYLGNRSGRRLTATIDIDGGRCRHIEFQDDSESMAIRMQFADLPAAAFTDADHRLADTFDTVQWIAGPHADTAAKLLRNREGYAMRSRCQMRGRTREVLVRMDGDAAETDWIPLTDCTIDNNGIVTGPALRQQSQLHLTAHKNAVAATHTAASGSAALPDNELAELMQPIIDELITAMNRADRAHAKPLLLRYREELRLVRESDLDTMKTYLAAIKRWVSGGPAVPLTPSKKPTTPPPPREREPVNVRPDPTRRSSSTPKKKTLSGERLQALEHTVAELEHAHQQKDFDTVRTLLHDHNVQLRALERTRDAPALRQRLQAVRLWFINNQPAGGPTATPTRVAARVFPHRTTTHLEELLRAAAARRSTLLSNELATQLGIAAADLPRFLRTIGRADLDADIPLLAALVIGADSSPGRYFRQIAQPLGCQRVRRDWGWEMVQEREIARVHAYYTQRRVPPSLLDYSR